MIFTKNDVRRLGERLRDGSTDPEDLAQLDSVRRAYDALLIETTHSVGTMLRMNNVNFIVSGRSKRTKSIIRKLRRPKNQTMDLSRMQDIVGIRVIVDNVADQENVVQILRRNFEGGSEIFDFRNDGRPYRTMHVVLWVEDQNIEVQIRTIPQHLWAVESESFGEQVKEGTLTGDPLSYLTTLAEAGKRLDAGEVVTDVTYTEVPLFSTRQPLEITLSNISTQFRSATAITTEGGGYQTFIVVFDNEVGALLNTYVFSADDRARALEEYHKIASRLTDERYEALLFNAKSPAILQATHPRFFVA